MRAARRSRSPAPVTTTLPDITTSSAAETEELGRNWGKRLRSGDVVRLKGELGAGKTTFVRGVAQGTGSSAPVASPTFQLVRIYPGRVQLAHVDLEDLATRGAVVVEWGERLDVDGAALIEFEHLGGDRRRIRTISDLSH